jgi:uncharacterized protein (UPF0248 family)
MVYNTQIANYFFDLLENNYYIHLKQLYNKKIDEIMNIEKITILKAEHFILLQYYFIYLINNSITNKSFIFITLFLNGFYSLDIMNTTMINNFYNDDKNRLINLKYYSFYILYYTIFLKTYISCSINLFNKIIFSSCLSSYYLLYKINSSYKKRVNCIENNIKDIEFDHFERKDKREINYRFIFRKNIPYHRLENRLFSCT